MTRLTKAAWISGALIAIAYAGLLLFVTIPRSDETHSYAGAALGALDADQLSDRLHQIVPDMLGAVYRAFGETDEAAIYDGLAEVSAGDALEALYLERLGAMVGGGLEQSDQQIHEMELIRLSSRRSGTTFMIDAKWRVVGTVGHATHLHVRGNTYAAALTLEPVEGIWRITAFDLTDVDRSDAGTVAAAR